MRETCTSGSVGAPGGQPPGSTRSLQRTVSVAGARAPTPRPPPRRAASPGLRPIEKPPSGGSHLPAALSGSPLDAPALPGEHHC